VGAEYVQPHRHRGFGDPKSVVTRLEQVLWVLDHLDDLASDFSAIHGIRDMTKLSGAAFLKMAYRMSAYESVMQARYREQDGGSQQASPGGAAQPRSGGQREMVPATKAALQANPVMAGIFSFGSSKPE
jgi:hypothetical protein